MADIESREITGETAMIEFGRELAQRLVGAELVFVRGDLGAGKTTLVRGILAGLGHSSCVPSPTYTLLEPYSIDGREVVHLDLYRLNDPAELEMLGARDFLGECLCLVEWPERAAGYLPAADVDVRIAGSGTASRTVTVDQARR